MTDEFESRETVEYLTENTALTRQQARAFKLAYISDEHYTSEEIGEELGISDSNVRTKLKTAREKISGAADKAATWMATGRLRRHVPDHLKDSD